MGQDWRIYRPAIWLAMLGVALILVLNPPRERPNAWSAGSWARFVSFDSAPCVGFAQRASRVLVRAGDGGIDREQVA